MRTLIIGVDSGTQSTKALVVEHPDRPGSRQRCGGLWVDSESSNRSEGTTSALLAQRPSKAIKAALKQAQSPSR